MKSALSRIENRFILMGWGTFIVLTYLPGLLFYPYFKENFEGYYTYSGQPIIALIFTVIMMVFLCIIFHLLIKPIPHLKVKPLSKKLCNNLFLSTAIIYLILGVYFFLNYDISFRHRQRLSESGFLIIILFFLRYVALFYLLWYLSVILKKLKPTIKMKVTLSFFTIGWLLAINGSFQIFYIFFAVLLLVNPKIYLSMSLKQIVIFFILCPFSLSLVLLIGVANKVGFELLFSPEGKDFMLNYIGTIVARSSTSLYSLGYSFENYFTNPSLAFDLISYEIYTFTNRLALLGVIDTFDSKSIYTVSRFNYLVSFENQADRGGSTPGILASIYFAGGLPIGFFLITFYISLLFRRLSRIFLGVKRFSLVSVFALVYVCIPFFENPISFFNIVQPPMLYLVFVFFISRFLMEPNNNG